MRKSKFLVFSGSAHPKLGESICHYLNMDIGKVYFGRFPDGEIDIKVNSDVRGADVFVVQSVCPPVNENLMELLILIDCLKRASAERITAVIPYYGYARKDRKDEGRVPITAKLVADLLTTAGTNRVLTLDLHADQIQGFFDIPVDHLLARAIFIPYLNNMQIKKLSVVSPDIGSVKQASAYAKRLGAELAVTSKKRDFNTGQIVSMNVLGDVADKNVVIVDDMISTAGTIAEAARLVKAKGALDIYLCATHAVLCKDAVEQLRNCPAKEIIVSNSIPVPLEKLLPNMTVLSLGPYLGEAIRRINNSESVSYLFEHPVESCIMPQKEQM
jgi:ribose-phosphate pyrophosphokinase